MARKFEHCIDCGTTDKKESCSLCDSCRKARRIKRLEKANANKHKSVGKTKACKECGQDFITKGPASLYCEVCGPKIGKEKLQASRRRAEAKRGTMVGIGSGNYFGKYNTEHPSYKNGITWYRDIARQKGESTCSRCGCDLDFDNQYMWCVHHIDHNRDNNSPQNLELLCKRCHQLEHNCVDNLPNK